MRGGTITGMWKTHLWNLFHHAKENTLVLGGSTLAGIVVVGIIGVIFGFILTALIEWWKAGWNMASLRDSLKTWPPYVGAIGGLLFAWFLLFSWSVCFTVYKDHQDLISANSNLREKIKAQQNSAIAQPESKKPSMNISTKREIGPQVKPCTPASLNDEDGSLSTPPRKPNIAFIGAKGETEISGGGEVGYDVGVDDSCGKSLNVKNFQAIAPHNDLTDWFHYLLSRPLDRKTIEGEIAAEQATLAQYGRSIRPEIVTRLRNFEDDPQGLKRYIESVVAPSAKP